MTQGKLYKKLSTMFDGYFDDRYEFADVLKVLDEAKKDLQHHIIQAATEQGLSELEEYETVEDYDSETQLEGYKNWIKKWFGDADQ